MWELAIRLNLRHLRKQWLRTILAFVGIVISVVVFVFSPALADTIRTTIEQTTRDLGGNASLEIRPVSGGIEESRLSSIREQASIELAAPLIMTGGLYTQERTVMAFIGIDPSIDEQVRAYHFVAGNMPTDESQVMLTADFVDEMGLSLGDEITLLGIGGTRTLSLVGILSVDSGLARLNSGDVAIVGLEDAFALKGSRSFDSIALITEASQDLTRLSTELEVNLGDDLIVDNPAGRFQQSHDFSNFTTFLLGMVSFLLSSFAAVLLHNSVSISIAQRRSEIGILRALGMDAGDIKRLYILESGIFGLIGSTVGVLLGYWMVRAAQGMPVLPADFNGMGLIASEAMVDVPLWLLPVAFGLGVGFSLIAAFSATRQIAKVEAIEALVQIRAETGRIEPAKWRIPVGVALVLLTLSIPFVIAPMQILPTTVMIMLANNGVLFCMAALIILYSPVVRLLQDSLPTWLESLFGLEGMLAASNFIRRPKRMLATGIFLACAVSMGVYISQSVFGHSDYIDAWSASQNVGDIVVTSAGEDALSPLLPLPSDVVASILEAPEIAQSYGERQVNINQDGKLYTLRAMDMASFFEAGGSFIFDRGNEAEANSAILDESENAIFLSTGSSTNLVGFEIGSILSLDTPTGRHDFRIYGIVFGGISPQNSMIVMNRSVYERYWNDNQLDRLTLMMSPDADSNALRREILSRYALRGVLAFDAVEMREAYVLRTVQSIQTVSSMMTGLLITVLVVGIGSTFYILILDRRREIGMLRAAGMQASQIATAVLLEMSILFVIGAVLGVPIALLGQACQDIFIRGMVGISLAVNPNQILIMVAFVFILTIIAAFIPARVASKTNVLEAMRYE